MVTSFSLYEKESLRRAGGPTSSAIPRSVALVVAVASSEHIRPPALVPVYLFVFFPLFTYTPSLNGSCHSPGHHRPFHQARHNRDTRDRTWKTQPAEKVSPGFQYTSIPLG